MAEERPKPAYGEYAPEGWEWKPEENAAGRPGEGSLADNRQQPSSLTGVPHNLGTSSTGAPASPETREPRPAAHAEGAAYRAPAPGLLPAPAAKRPRTGDRIVTIALLVLGGVGALWMAASLYQMPATFELMAAAFKLEGFVVPETVRTLSMVGALLVFAIYALNLVYSVQRLRHGKLAFWVPLVAAVVAFIIVFAFSAIAANQAPDLMREFAHPDAMNRMFDYLAQMSQTP